MENLGQYQSYNAKTKQSLLCLNQKLQIANNRESNMLNKWTETISKCRHRSKYALARYNSMEQNIKHQMRRWSFLKFLKFVAILFVAVVK